LIIKCRTVRITTRAFSRMINKSAHASISEFIFCAQDQEVLCQAAFKEDFDAALMTSQQK